MWRQRRIILHGISAYSMRRKTYGALLCLTVRSVDFGQKQQSEKEARALCDVTERIEVAFLLFSTMMFDSQSSPLGERNHII